MPIKRRHLFIGAAGAASALVVRWRAAPPRQRLLAARPLDVSAMPTRTP